MKFEKQYTEYLNNLRGDGAIDVAFTYEEWLEENLDDAIDVVASLDDQLSYWRFTAEHITDGDDQARENYEKSQQKLKNWKAWTHV